MSHTAFVDNNPKLQKEFWQIGGFHLPLHALQLHIQDYSHNPIPLSAEQIKQAELAKLESEKEMERLAESEKSNKALAEGKNIVATIDIVDVKDQSRTEQETKGFLKFRESRFVTLYFCVLTCCQKLEGTPELWLRLARKVCFFFNKLMADTEQFRLAFAKDTEILGAFLNLLSSQSNTNTNFENGKEDAQLKELLLKCLQTMTTSDNKTMQNYITGILKASTAPQILHQQKLWVDAHLGDHSYDYQAISDILKDLLQKI